MTITQEPATWFAQTFSQLADNVERAVLGKRHVVELVLTAMLSDGHVLLEDAPGTGKTFLARAIGASAVVPFHASSLAATTRAGLGRTSRPRHDKCHESTLRRRPAVCICGSGSRFTARSRVTE